MEDQEKKNINTEPEQSPLANTDFMREKIKERPVNKRKLLRRTVITVTLAVIFGMVACITFLLLEPVISARLSPQPDVQTVTFPEETEDDELQPEQMIADEAEREAQEEAATTAAAINEVASGLENDLQQAIKSYTFDVSDYGEMTTALRQLTKEISKSLVTVTGVRGATDWINDAYEKSGSESGVILADNGAEYLILVNTSAISGANDIRVTFIDESYASASLKESDTITGLSVIAVDKDELSPSTQEEIQIAKLGSSDATSLTGTAVIAVGAPTGTIGSVCYGYITSSLKTLDLPDTCHRLITTDIYGSPSGSGVLVNLSGQVIGIINMSYNDSGYANALSGYGITKLKPVIEKLSNQSSCASLGVHGTDVPTYVATEESVPNGAYITQVELSSPAMNGGIQSGDVITKIDTVELGKFEDLVYALQNRKPESDVTLTVMRQSTEGYSEMQIDVTLGTSTTAGETE